MEQNNVNNARQLSAIMFTDIVGYTAIMQGDEAKAIRMRAKHRAAFRGFHALYGGEVIQYYGDGTLSIFKSAVNAALCAIELQKRLQQGDPVPVRIGLHLGDIIFDQTEVYGDAVNLASRIENLGTASSILLSGKFNDELKNHPAISTTSLGTYELKNISAAVEVFAIANEGITVPTIQELTGKQKKSIKTIAVLPFANLSGEPENEGFSDSITEEVITALSKVKNLQVTSRTTSFAYKNKQVALKEIAHNLNASAIIEGSIRRSNNKARITAQLINTAGDFPCWSETWDVKYKDGFDIQKQIALRIVSKVQHSGTTQETHATVSHKFSLVHRMLSSCHAIKNILMRSITLPSWSAIPQRTLTPN
jgi:adenylate cyclase